MKNIHDFYLRNHDFQVIVNKGCQTYGKTPDEMMATATIQEIYKEMQEGGINEERDNRKPHTVSVTEAGC